MFKHCADTGYSQLTARVGTKLCRRINENGGYVNSNFTVIHVSENLNSLVNQKCSAEYVCFEQSNVLT